MKAACSNCGRVRKLRTYSTLRNRAQLRADAKNYKSLPLCDECRPVKAPKWEPPALGETEEKLLRAIFGEPQEEVNAE